MGITVFINEEEFLSGVEYSKETHILESLKYHSSWDYLMPVVRVITEMAVDNDWLYDSDEYTFLRDTLSGARINEVHESVVAVIKFINENK